MGAVHMQITTIGLDIAKNVFQVHGIDGNETVVVRKQLRRGKLIAFFESLAPCLVGIEACATAHHWARELTRLGHQVRLMPAKDVKAYVKRNKNDAADAAAICEAVRRPTMRFVRIKSTDQQCQLMQHRTRDLMMRQRTQLINALRAHLAELGIVAAMGDKGVTELLMIVADEDDGRLPVEARASLALLAAQLNALQMLIGSLEKQIKMQHRANPASQRLETIPGIGIIGATAIAATVADPTVFRSGRDFAAWIGLVPRQESSGGKHKLGSISKRGDRYLRRILVVGAHSVLRRAMEKPGKYPWLTQLMARRPFKVVAVALANKMARMAWALLTYGGTYRAPRLSIVP
jgi:transposase